MKRNLLRIGTILMCAMIMAACSDNNNDGPDPDPDPDPDPNPSEKVELWLVDKIADKAEGGEVYTFKYNSDYTLSSITRTGRSEGTYKFVYDKDGKLIETTDFNAVIATYSYDGNTITVECNDERPVTTLNISDKGKLQEASFDVGAVNFFKFEYDDKGRVNKTSAAVVSGDEEPVWGILNTYRYDDKNSIVHDGMLPEWFYFMTTLPTTGFSMIPYAIDLTPLNNIQEYYVGGDETFAGDNLYHLEYNEEGYPVLWAQTGQGGQINENTAMTITYKVIELEVEDE